MPKKILLADDSITIQKVVELTFSDGDYEVSAVNNGAKAIQKLAELRPDIILSDIIMPEKNGYEVCEYVKSHPEFRNIPVVLLTGTFEPFDPDQRMWPPLASGSFGSEPRAFAKMSLEGLQQRAPPQPEQVAEPVQPPAAAAEPSPWDAVPEESAAASDTMSPFAAPEPPAEPEPLPEASPWDQPPAFGGETRAFPKLSFEEMQQLASAPPAPAPAPFAAEETASPFGESLAEQEAPFEPEMTAPPALADEPAWSPTQPEPAPSLAPAAMADLSEEQIDRIARRVVQLMSEQVVRN